MPRETVHIRDWPQGPWRLPNGTHSDYHIANLETQLIGALQTQYDFPYMGGTTPQLLVPVIQESQIYLNVLEGRLQNLPREWGHEFRRQRNYGETLLDSWLQSKRVRIDLPIGRPEPDPAWSPMDAFGNSAGPGQVQTGHNFGGGGMTGGMPGAFPDDDVERRMTQQGITDL
jgi:hypothetical protein